ncbi:MAG TPA: hypothetical protein VJK52_05805 [Candidatus Nanoarchaeia archaeon]|nr:hypothetical protein [Candidatus Nanoarchaeia archaeon]
MPTQRLQLSPHALNRIGVDEASHGVDELPAVADGPTIQKTAVAAMLIGEDETLRITVMLDKRRQSFFAAVGNLLEETAAMGARHATGHPL